MNRGSLKNKYPSKYPKWVFAWVFTLKNKYPGILHHYTQLSEFSWLAL